MTLLMCSSKDNVQRTMKGLNMLLLHMWVFTNEHANSTLDHACIYCYTDICCEWEYACQVVTVNWLKNFNLQFCDVGQAVTFSVLKLWICPAFPIIIV